MEIITDNFNYISGDVPKNILTPLTIVNFNYCIHWFLDIQSMYCYNGHEKVYFP